jgi:hypothetical protein
VTLPQWTNARLRSVTRSSSWKGYARLSQCSRLPLYVYDGDYDGRDIVMPNSAEYCLMASTSSMETNCTRASGPGAYTGP